MKPIRAIGLIVAVACVGLSFSAAGELRKWTSSEGGFTVDAQFVELKNGTSVVLRKTDGLVIDVPIEKLSAADQAHLRTLSPDATPRTNASVPMGGTAAVPPNAASTVPLTPEQLAHAIEAVEREAERCADAREAVVVYEAFAATIGRSLSAEFAYTERLAKWRQRADKEMVRLGKDWMPVSEAEKAKRDARDLVRQGIDALRQEQNDQARECLQNAAKLDPNSPNADYLMGLVYALAARNYEAAGKHFAECLRRNPNDAGALNNVALPE
jgi:tetratricopeptide (TPR) repeat protein